LPVRRPVRRPGGRRPRRRRRVVEAGRHAGGGRAPARQLVSPRRSRRICSVAYTHYLSDPRVRREMEALADRGDDVTVLALQREGEPAEQVFGGVRIVGLPVARYRGTGTRAYLKSYADFFWRAFKYLARHRRRFD